MTLSREQILERRASLPRTTVDVPDFGEVLIRSLTLRQVGEINAMTKRDEPAHRMTARVIIMACINDDGTSLFTEADRPAIEELPSSLTTPLMAAIMRLGGLEEKAAPKASPESNGSSSDSPLSSAEPSPN